MVGAILEIYVKLYGKYVTNGKNGRKYMYIRIIKAVYETLKAVLLYYMNLSKGLRECGFVINTCDT